MKSLGATSVVCLISQLWALLSALVKGDDDARRTFANVTRHNGFEAWRRLAEPINNDKALLRKELLPRFTNPRPASNVDDVENALREWDTS